MGASRKLNSYDEWFRNAPHHTILINDLCGDSKTQREEINNLLYFISDNGEFNSIPSCLCGEKTGRYNIGMVCNNCNTPVTEIVADDIPSYLWVKQPRDVEKLINPDILMKLRVAYGKDNMRFDVFEWCMNPQYQSRSTSLDVITLLNLLEADPILSNRGYNNFVQNFDYLIKFLVDNNKVMKKNYDERITSVKWVLDVVEKAKREGVLFSEHVNLLNKALLVVEKASVSSYIDPFISDFISGIRLLIGIDKPGTSTYNMKPMARQNRVAKFLLSYSNFFNDYYGDALSGKPGLIRRLIMGTRLDYTFRSVITSITGPHRFDEIHIPWWVGMIVFRPHLTNKLYKKGWSYQQVVQYLNKYAIEYDPLLDSLFKELIAESPNGYGIPANANRNPTMHRGSYQLMFITKVKTDTNDNTIGLPELVVTHFNADFDGDQMNFTITLDNYTTEGFKYMTPETNIYHVDSLEPNSMVHLPEPVGMNVANWLNMEDLTVKPEVYSRMQSLAIT